MRRIVYRGSGTGLRLEDDGEGDKQKALDIHGSHAKGAPMHLWLSDGKGANAGADFEPAEVVLIMEQCAYYLARTLGVPEQ